MSMSAKSGALAPDRSGRGLSFVDLCSGAGGLALGLEQAGFDPVMVLDNHPLACETLRLNRPQWQVWEEDLRAFDPTLHQETYDVDLLSAGLPRVKAAAGVNRPGDSEAELELLRATVFVAHSVQPRALMIENMSELVTGSRYAPTRRFVEDELAHLGYQLTWIVVNAADYGVPQDRKQGIMLAFKGDAIDHFEVPAVEMRSETVGSALVESMGAHGWAGAMEWAAHADRIAPTLVGGSWNRGGADLGPTGSKRTWAKMGVDGATVVDSVPRADFVWNPSIGRPGLVPLTVEQVACLQGFPPDWRLAGRKTAQYRQIANASPPPVGRVLGRAIREALNAC
ncbi:DNA cytosine methyltransferase [Kribbella sp. CA-293567]|uniref:DNA cytosine methyltransferase n=1 Tax=Kribbella sp. CA-293567 TaxID=3002436 RepID=UPI0022DDF748|nr:DNA cytosine methyltransferase [Kribbella sp. CA-293567]WBQ07819.1 DNA cytosine methyltransferase [Kribbella sp. CA-293567]